MFSDFTTFLQMGCIRCDETIFEDFMNCVYFLYYEMTEPCVKHVRKNAYLILVRNLNGKDDLKERNIE